MSENYIVINGKKADLTPEQLKALGIESASKKNPFAVQSSGGRYYFINSCGCINGEPDDNKRFDNMRFNCANYCTDEELLLQQAYRETLNRLLWRFSMEHDGDKIDWNSGKYKYCLSFDSDNGEWGVDSCSICCRQGSVYFATYEIAEQAIREIIAPFMAAHPDFNL